VEVWRISGEPYHYSFYYNHGDMLYFPPRLYNRDGSFSTFYRDWIYRGFGTVLVSLVEPQLNVFFLLVLGGWVM